MTRVWLGKTAEALPLSDLSAVQKESFDQLLKEGILEVLEEINPIQDYTGRGWELSFNKPRYGKPRVSKEETIHKFLPFAISSAPPAKVAAVYLLTNIWDGFFFADA